MLPIDYIIIEKVSEYKEIKQKETATLNINNNPAPQNGIIIHTTIEPPDGWLEVDGKRYIVDGRTIIKTK